MDIHAQSDMHNEQRKRAFSSAERERAEVEARNAAVMANNPARSMQALFARCSPQGQALALRMVEGIAKLCEVRP